MSNKIAFLSSNSLQFQSKHSKIRLWNYYSLLLYLEAEGIMKRKFVVSLVLLVVPVLLVYALATYTGVLKSTYNVKPTSALAKAGCSSCHTTKAPNMSCWTLNVYGEALHTVLKTAQPNVAKPVLTAALLHKIDTLDSDSDGVKNGIELNAGTLPGDPASK